MAQVKNNETTAQDRVITIAAGENAISVLAVELQNHILDAIREGRLTPKENQLSSIVKSAYPYEVIDGEPNIEDGICISLFEDGGFTISISEYYSANSMPIHKAAKKMYNSIQSTSNE